METNKEVPFHNPSSKKSVPLCCLLRETGSIKKTGGPCKNLQLAAEEVFITKNHEEFTCGLPEGTRSTFLVVFSPDGKLIASTHGNHNVYVTDLTNGRNVKTLVGHPRTPWCIAFHPSSNQILASGCLGGQVRVWDLHGGSEIWSTDSHTVIASLAFHPIDRVLVIASYNEIHFWDWSQQKPFAKCCTANEREKVRYVAFDGLGEKLVTGIANAPRIFSQWDRVSAPQPPPLVSQAEHERRITICYRYMVEQYEQLIERYYQLSGNNVQSQNRGPRPSTMDRGTDPMEPAENGESGRCAVCRCPNSTDNNLPGPSSTEQNHNHSAGTDEVSASHSSSQFMAERNESQQQMPLTRRANYLYERLARLRTQVETGRSILARTRSAAAAMSARMSPSDPEDSYFFLDRPQPRNSTDTSRSESNNTSPSLLMLPEPLLPETAEDRPSFISRIGSYINRRRSGPRFSDSSSSDASISDNTPTWQRPLTPPPSQSQRLTNLNSPFSRRVVFDPVEPPAGMSQSVTNIHSQSSSNRTRPSPLWLRSSGTSASTSLSSRSMSEPTNGSDSEADNVLLRQDMDNNFSHWRVFLRYRYFRDSGSNTEPPSDSNSSDSISSRYRTNFESASAIARLRSQFRRLQSDYRERDNHLLRQASASAERRLLFRLANLIPIPFPSTSSSSDSPRFTTPPESNSTDLGGVRFGIQLIGRHIENLFRQCRDSRLDIGEMRRLWDNLETNIYTLHDAVRDGAPVVRVSPGNQVDAEGVASTSSLPTDEESEDSSRVFTAGRRCLGPRRFRYLHRVSYKRPRIDRIMRPPRRNPQATSPDDDSDENEGGDNASSRQSESSDGDNRGVKRKSMSNPSTTPATTASTSSNTEMQRNMLRPLFHPSRLRTVGGRYRFRSPTCFRPWMVNRELNRDRSSGGMWINLRESPLSPSAFRERDSTQEDPITTRTRNIPPTSTLPRDVLRNRSRHVFLMLLDSLAQFFDNDLSSRPSTDEILRARVTDFINLLQLALNLSEGILSQLDFASTRSNRGSESTSATTTSTTTTTTTTPRDPPRGGEGSGRRRTMQPRRLHDEIFWRSGREDNPPLLPVLRVNDGPVPLDPPSNTLRESPPPLPPMPQMYRPRFLHPRYRTHVSVDESSEDSSQDRGDLYFLRGLNPTVVLTDAALAPHHRIQVWDFTKYSLPEIHIADKNIVVKECKVHNDASVDISSDGKLLVTLLPSGRLSITTMLGIYSMQWDSLGQCLYTTSFDQNAVSVSLSPTTQHLVVGLASRRVHFFHTDRQTVAQIFKLEKGNPAMRATSKGRLVLVRDLEMSRESTDFMSLNCIRWAPSPGEAFVYGTNTGKLKILR